MKAHIICYNVLFVCQKNYEHAPNILSAFIQIDHITHFKGYVSKLNFVLDIIMLSDTHACMFSNGLIQVLKGTGQNMRLGLCCCLVV